MSLPWMPLLALIGVITLWLASWYSEAESQGAREPFTGEAGDDVQGYNASLQYENAADSDERPWTRHPISSVLADTKPQQAKHRNIYNFELENNAFTRGLKEALGSECRSENMVLAKDLTRKDSPWTAELPPDRAPTGVGIECYKGAIDWLARKVRRAPSLRLPDPDSEQDIQVVHDRWISYRQKLDGGGGDILLRVEVLFYREAKYHGKHYELWIRCKAGNYTVVSLTFKGMVFEDQIALYPVAGTDETDLRNQRWAPPL